MDENNKNREILNYINEARTHGIGDSQIKENLLNVGWESSAIDENFPVAVPTNAAPTPLIDSAQNPQQSGPPLPKSNKNRLKVSIIAVVVIILVSFLGYAYFAYGFNTPAKVWQKFAQNPLSTIYQNKFSLTYSDPGSLENDSSGLNLQLKDIKLNFTGSGYINSADINNPSSKSDVQYTFSSGNTSFSTGLKYILLDKTFYLNTGSNPFLNLMFSQMSAGQKHDWIKINFEELNNKLPKSSQADYKQLNEFLSPSFKNEMEKIWNNSALVKEEKYLGREKINGANTIHFKNSLDKSALKNLISQYVAAVAKAFGDSGNKVTQENIDTINQITAQILDKVQIKEFETWISISDFKLYKVHFVSNVPSFISLIKNTENLYANPEPNMDPKLQAANFISKLDFSATLSSDIDYSGYGNAQKLEAPADAFDLGNAIQQQLLNQHPPTTTLPLLK